MDIKKHKILLGLLPFIFLVAAFEILPLINIINNSLMDSEKNIYSFKQYITALGSPFILQSIKNSIKIALFSTLLGMIIALGAAYSISNLKPAARERVLMLSNMTSNFAGVPLAFAFIILMGNNGLFTLLLQKMGLNIFEGFDLYSGLGLIIVYIYFQVPLGILLMYPAFDGIKEQWKEAASLLGASFAEFWRLIGIPVLLPSILGTSIVLFSNSMGAYATAVALTTGNYNLLTIRIASLISGDVFVNPQLASALSVILGMILIAAMSVNELILKKRKGI